MEGMHSVVHVFYQVFNREAVGGFLCVIIDKTDELLTLHDPHIKFNQGGLFCYHKYSTVQ